LTVSEVPYDFLSSIFSLLVHHETIYDPFHGIILTREFQRHTEQLALDMFRPHNSATQYHQIFLIVTEQHPDLYIVPEHERPVPHDAYTAPSYI
jgi:hypothetical protein